MKSKLNENVKFFSRTSFSMASTGLMLKRRNPGTAIQEAVAEAACPEEVWVGAQVWDAQDLTTIEGDLEEGAVA